MIAIILLRSEKLEDFQHRVKMLNMERSLQNPALISWAVIELQGLMIEDIPAVRAALICDELPPPGMFEIPIEAVIPDKRYCPQCAREGVYTPLRENNGTGYCYTHRELSEARREKKRSKGKRGRGFKKE